MSGTPGTRFGPHEVTSILGTGGMGEVTYRARDGRLDRDVALKVLASALTVDADRLLRFKREAQVLASLNHHNIAAIYGLEEGRPVGSQPLVEALVLELVEGPTLAERLAGGPLPLALPLASQAIATNANLLLSFAISSDGTRLVYAGRDNTGSSLYLQDLVSGGTQTVGRNGVAYSSRV